MTSSRVSKIVRGVSIAIVLITSIWVFFWVGRLFKQRTDSGTVTMAPINLSSSTGSQSAPPLSGDVTSPLPPVSPPAAIPSVETSPITPPPLSSPDIPSIPRYTAGAILSISSDTLKIMVRDQRLKTEEEQNIHLTDATEIFRQFRKDQETFLREWNAFREHPPKTPTTPPSAFTMIPADRKALKKGEWVEVVIDTDTALGERVTASKVTINDLPPPAPL